MSEIRGVYAAAVTPRGDDGTIDFGAAFELVDFLCRGGVDGIALYSAAGESAALSAEERSRLVFLAVKRSRVPVLVGVGSATLDGSVALARAARDACADGLLLPPPFAFAYEQDDLREFYVQFAEQVGSETPIFLAQSPVGSNLDADTAIELLSSGYFAGMEFGGSAIQRIQAARDGNPWRILGIDDARFVESRGLGVQAAISAAACALPELMAGLEAAIRASNGERVRTLEARLHEFLAWVEQFPQPAVTREATRMRGLKVGGLGVPLSPAKQQRMAEFRAWFQTWLPETKKLAAHG